MECSRRLQKKFAPRLSKTGVKLTKQFWNNIRFRATQVTPWQTATASAIGLIFVYLAAMSVELHRGLNTSAYDFGLYDQGIWLMSQFKNPFVTLMGRNLFGDHTSFVLLLLVPFYWVVSSSSFLFIVQSIVISAGAIPVFLYTRKRLESEMYATVFAVVYLIHPASIWIGLENYHPDSFLGLFVGIALYAALEKNWRLYFIATILSLSVKEDIALVLVPLGVWIAFRRSRRIGLLTIAMSSWYMILAFFGVQKGINGADFRNSWRIPFGGIGGLIRTTFSDPGKLASYLLSESRPYYLLQMVLPLALLFMMFPEVAAIALLVIGTNILSTFWYQFHIQYHYSFVIVPIFVFGTVYAIGRVSMKYRTWLVGACAVMSLFSAYMWAPVPGGRTEISYNGSGHPMVDAATEALSKVPSNAIVSAYHPLTAHLARRDRIYAFPVPFRRSLYGLDAFAKGDVLPFVDDIEYVILPKNLDEPMSQVWAEVASRFEITYANSWWVVYKRIAK